MFVCYCFFVCSFLGDKRHFQQLGLYRDFTCYRPNYQHRKGRSVHLSSDRTIKVLYRSRPNPLYFWGERGAIDKSLTGTPKINE